MLGFKVGAVGIRPNLSVAERFSDNITYTSGDIPFYPKQSDFITIISPGVIATAGHEETGKLFSVGYRLDALMYADNGKYNALDHNVNLSATISGNRLTSTTTATVGYASSIYTGYDRIIEGIYLPAGNTDRLPYNFSTRLALHATPKTDAYLGASFNGLVFPNNTTLLYRDRNDWRVTLGGDYAVRPKLRVLAEAYYAQSFYSAPPLGGSSSEWDRVGGNLGFRTDLSARLSGSVRVGYEFWERDAQPGDTLTTTASLGYRLTERTRLSLNFSRGARESVSTASGSYISYQGGLGVEHRLGTKRPVILAANAKASLNDYESGTEHSYYTLGVSGAYMLRDWLRLMLAYQFESRDGSAGVARNYTVNSVTLSVAAGY
ncbi:MAG: outer membrane beta-barrel protein [Verrucomicrobiales bacterium]|nr:outer membrane beta-barrel protein [Verrucomicrobiales bacterium]